MKKLNLLYNISQILWLFSVLLSLIFILMNAIGSNMITEMWISIGVMWVCLFANIFILIKILKKNKLKNEK